MQNPDLMLGIAFLVGLVTGWVLRGGRRAQLGEDDTLPSTPAARLAHAQAIQDAALRERLQAGDKIGAIKRYRMLTGSGLKESKDAIDRMA